MRVLERNAQHMTPTTTQQVPTARHHRSFGKYSSTLNMNVTLTTMYPHSSTYSYIVNAQEPLCSYTPLWLSGRPTSYYSSETCYGGGEGGLTGEEELLVSTFMVGGVILM